MATICKADYYYGALLSALVNGGLAPALFEKENDNRQIYEVTTNKASYIIYTKYNTTPSGSKDFTWSFSFSDNEIEEITKIHQENNKEKIHGQWFALHSGMKITTHQRGIFTEKELIFAFICSQKQLSDYNQVIAIVYWDEFLECVDIEKEQVRGTARLAVKAVKGSPWLRIYGSKRADRLDGKDNTIKIERNRLGNL
ncbi:hypothetical protein B4114_1194 [Geobacillus stearothermophilus]|uniref:Uncharacterized protein n=1 Tax=Geobacillus stearothermophilus TaxID=1422 RepID=A0A150NFA4_GEOSE|nr:hypothetical protein [Geobacillus stearothermophilus]KYD35381.1 hypothetical protein B4114_1194 [Geobacillus stearothermophilus]